MGSPADRAYEHLLVLRCQTGDESAFAQLVEAYHPRLRLYVTKMLGRGPAAEDVLQEIWLEAFRGLPGLRDSGAVCGWLYRIAHSKACQVLRRREPPRATIDEADNVADDAAGNDDDFSAEEAAAIHAALDGLSPDHREVLLLRFVEQMSYEQMAAVTGCGVGTVRSRLHYAKRSLRRALERNYYG